MNQTFVAEFFDVLIANTKARFCAAGADEIADAFLRIVIELLKTLCSIDRREKPVAPCQFMILRTFQ